MFDWLLKSKFFLKCKSRIKLTRTRIEVITNKRNAIQKCMRNDVADQLRIGLYTAAFARAEGLLAEMIRSQCYELIDQYCEHISKNLSAMNRQGECPEECREAAASLIFAAARFGDLPELRKLRTMFSERYVNPLDYYVNRQFTEKLKADRPSKDMKLQLLQEIAAESGLKLGAKALKKKLFNESAYAKNRVQKDATGYEYFHSAVKIKDSEVDTVRRAAKPKEAASVSKVPEEDEEDEPLKQRRTPCTKPIANKATSRSSDKRDSSNYKMEPTVKGKPMGKSVRTKQTKPSPGQEVAGADEKETVKEVVNKETVAQGKRILKFFDCDEEEKVMDKTRRHYSRKTGSNKNGKSEAELKLPPIDSSKEKNLRSRDGPTRASSLRVEPTSPAEIDPRKNSRAASFHPYNAHVHPKLPDYDEIVAQFRKRAL